QAGRYVAWAAGTSCATVGGAQPFLPSATGGPEAHPSATRSWLGAQAQKPVLLLLHVGGGDRLPALLECLQRRRGHGVARLRCGLGGLRGLRGREDRAVRQVGLRDRGRDGEHRSDREGGAVVTNAHGTLLVSALAALVRPMQGRAIHAVR